MNIQIFGKSKCFDTKKAQRWFKERRIKYQDVDLPRYGLSMGEYKSVKQAVGGLEALIDKSSPLYESLFIEYLADDAAREEKLLDNPGLFRTPIVRNGKKATVGYCPEVWKQWEESEK
ncbi:MAG: ArsC family transcriptional regulator [Ruminococcaceae bacterium]|jgi:arsenate reductase-like glutaredoxin family protein|nr:ArsC family transcriptional regulator [Oscillospiraceae bacterium]